MIKRPPNKDHFYYYHHEFFHTDLNITRAFLEKDYDIGMHQQEFYEINIITKGEGIHFIEENKIPAKVGSVFIIPPNITHGYIGGKNFNVFHILLSEKFMQKNITDLQQLPNFYMLFNAEPLMRTTTRNLLHLSLDKKQIKVVFEIINKLLDLDDKTDSITSLIKSNICMVLITYLCSIYPTSFNSKNTESDESFMKSISYIHKHYNEKITIEDLCKISHLSRSTYIRKFKEIVKIPPSTYINKQRIEAAKNMLITTNYSLSEIAYRTGFYDAPHFIKNFELETNITPTNYKKTYKK